MDSRANILFLNSRSEYGGADMGLLSIVKYLSKEQYRAWVVLPKDGPLVRSMLDAGADVLQIPLAKLERLDSVADLLAFPFCTFRSTIRLARLIRAKSIDLVYTNSSAIQAGALAAKLAGVPHVWHIREIWTEPRLITRPLYRLVRAASSEVIAITEAVARADFGAAADGVHIIGDSIDPRRFATRPDLKKLREELGIPADAPVVGTVARLVPQKGLHHVLEAAEMVLQECEDAYFLVVGDIPRPRYQEYKDQLLSVASRPPLSGRVVFTGWRQDVPDLLRLMDVFALCSTGPEGLGSVIAEAWWAGRPVVAPDHSGPAEVVSPGQTGLLYRSGVASDLAENVLSLLREPELAERLAFAGHTEAQAKYSAAVNVGRIEEIFDSLLKRENDR
jgi:glycosyltransferase involved in cell wall biosynthesis